MGRPVSNASIAATRAPRASMPSAILLSTRALARAARPGQGPRRNASSAAATARSMSSAWPAAARAYTWLDTGSATSNVAPPALGTSRPPMKCSIFSGTGWLRGCGWVTGHSPIVSSERGGRYALRATGSPSLGRLHRVTVTGPPSLPAGPPRLVGGLPAFPERVQAVDGFALADMLGGELLLQLLLGGVKRHLHGQVRGDHDDPVAVAGDDVVRRDGDAGAGDDAVHLPRYVPPPEHRRVRRAVVDRQVHGVQRLAVPDRAVGEDARRAAHLGAQREYVAHRARGRVAAGLDDDDLARPHLLDGALLRVQAATGQRPAVLGEQVLAERHVAQRPGEPDHLRVRPGGAQPVEGDGVEAALAQLG